MAGVAAVEPSPIPAGTRRSPNCVGGTSAALGPIQEELGMHRWRALWTERAETTVPAILVGCSPILDALGEESGRAAHGLAHFRYAAH